MKTRKPENKTIWYTIWPLHKYYAAYIDPKKSVPHMNIAGQLENPKALPFWIPEQRYLVSIEDYLDVISEIEHDEYVVNDPTLKRPLLKFWVEKGKSAIYDGKLGNGMIYLQHTDDLLAIRKRDDGMLGIESISRIVDTRVSIAEDLKKPGLFPPLVPKTNKKEANFSNLTKLA